MIRRVALGSSLLPMLAFAFWQLHLSDGSTVPTPLNAVAETNDPSDNPLIAQSATSPTEVLRSFFGVPVRGRVVGFVLDHDAAMSRYMDGIGFMACAATTAMEPSRQRFAMAVARESAPMVVGPSRVEQATIAAARSRVFGTFPSEATDLAAAMQAASDWQPEQLFVVFAKAPTRQLSETLVQRARETGAVVNVVALGGARSEALGGRAIADATGGRFVAVDDGEFDRAVHESSSAIINSTLKLQKDTRR